LEPGRCGEELGLVVEWRGRRPGRRQASRKPHGWSCGRGALGSRSERMELWSGLPWCGRPRHRDESGWREGWDGATSNDGTGYGGEEVAGCGAATEANVRGLKVGRRKLNLIYEDLVEAIID
jgi:hypothetical protein